MTDEKNVLPHDPTLAVKQMTKLIEQLMDLIDQESMALARRDSVAFTGTQYEKEQLSKTYEKTSAEFGKRLSEFHAVDAALVDKLAAKQKELKKKALESTAAMERMQG